MFNALKALAKSRKVLLALLGVVNSVLYFFVPDFPKEIWQSVNIFLGLVIAGITIEDAALKASGRTPGQ
jgi:hypothetical protein